MEGHVAMDTYGGSSSARAFDSVPYSIDWADGGMRG